MMMRNVFLAVAAITALVAGAGWYALSRLMPEAVPAEISNPEHATLATRFLDHLDAGRYDDALAMGTPRLREGLAGGKLATTWETLPKQLGARTQRSAVRGETVEGQPVLSATLVFPMMPLDARITFDDANHIAGFWVVPARAGAPTAPEDAAREDGGHEVAFTVGSGTDALPGTLSLPDGAAPFTAVVLVHGSGSHDRDETIGPNAPFRDLAHGLAARGIAVLRYEKRNRVQPDRYTGRAYTVDDETTDDALTAVAALRARADIDGARIFVAGHSLGALVAPRIGARDPTIAGLILLAAPALPLEDTVVRQTRHLLALESKSQADIEAAVADLETARAGIKHIAADVAGDTPSLLALPTAYWRDLAGYDPVAAARELRQPLLVLQGGRDYQVTVADDFARWRAAFASDPRVELREYPDLGHAFMPGGNPPGPKDYLVPGHVDAKVIADITTWIGLH